jgi:cystathionine beta-lyase/cystathionine gamma-synthase
MEFETLCVQGDRRIEEGTGAIATPIYQTATFAHPGLNETSGYDYTRQQNPTREQLEFLIAGLEDADGAIAFSSGMAALAALMELFLPGDHIVASGDLYGGTYRLFDQILAPRGLSFSYGADTDAVTEAIGFGTKAVFLETPTNPMMHVFDIARIAEAAHARGALLIVDNTFLTPYFQKPLTLGADAVLHSGTKYLGGHNDTIAGFLAARGDGLVERLRFIAKTTGSGLAPFDCFLLIRGIKTLALRLERSQENALQIALWLSEQPCVEAVHYPGLPAHPDFALSRTQSSGFGAMISFSVVDVSLVKPLLERVRVIRYAESLGGAESLITYPMLQTHADIPEEDRLSIGINDRLLRLSVGIESVRDLINDLAQALGARTLAPGGGQERGDGQASGARLEHGVGQMSGGQTLGGGQASRDGQAHGDGQMSGGQTLSDGREPRARTLAPGDGQTPRDGHVTGGRQTPSGQTLRDGQDPGARTLAPEDGQKTKDGHATDARTLAPEDGQLPKDGQTTGGRQAPRDGQTTDTRTLAPEDGREPGARTLAPGDGQTTGDGLAPGDGHEPRARTLAPGDGQTPRDGHATGGQTLSDGREPGARTLAPGDGQTTGDGHALGEQAPSKQATSKHAHLITLPKK